MLKLSIDNKISQKVNDLKCQTAISRSGLTFRYACSGYKVYAKIINRQQNKSKGKIFKVSNYFDPNQA